MSGVTRTTGDVIAELKMARSAFSGALLVLEGITDSKFWRQRINTRSCQITIAGGKSTALSATKTLDEEGFRRLLTIVDDDFDHFLGKDYTSSNIAATDVNDLETMLASSPALEKVFVEHSDRTPRIDGTSAFAAEKKVILDLSLIYGRLRYVNRERGLNLSFEKNYSPWKYINLETLVLDEARLIADICAECGQPEVNIRTWLSAVPIAPIWNLVRGHDFTCVTAIVVKKMLPKASLSEDRFCAALRIAYEAAWLEATAIHAFIRNWEGANAAKVLT